MMFQFEPGHHMEPETIRAGISALLGITSRTKPAQKTVTHYMWQLPAIPSSFNSVIEMEVHCSGLVRVYVRDSRPELADVIRAWLPQTSMKIAYHQALEIK